MSTLYGREGGGGDQLVVDPQLDAVRGAREGGRERVGRLEGRAKEPDPAQPGAEPGAEGRGVSD